MRLRCPNCRTELDVVPEPTVVEVACPSCGTAVDLSGIQPTATFVRAKLGYLGPFELVEHIGRGHFGDVYRAKDSRLDREVAVKVPRHTTELGQKEREAFFREARTAAQLRHPNIVTVHEVGTAGDVVFIASEFIDGVNLAELLAERKLPPRRAAEICLRVAEALHHAHEQNVIHRDLKPRNIMLDADGEPHLLDFGVAKSSAAEFTITTAGEILGTPAYMAPEQARGDAASADRRTDIYTLGVTLYELLTGVRPFQGEVRGLIYQILHEEPTPPRKLVAEVPRDLETICLKAMAKRPYDRYDTAEELADDLRRYLADEPIKARPAGAIERAWRWSRRNPAWTTAGGLGTVAAAALCLLAYGYATGDAGPGKRTVEIDVRLAEGPFQKEGDPRASPPVQVVFWPLDREGNPVLDQPVRVQGAPPLRARLAPGDYFVVAVEEASNRFHEVFRHVPAETEKPFGVFRHERSRSLADGAVAVPEITLPLPGVTNGMTRISGSKDFVMGDDSLEEIPAHHRGVPPFFLDSREVTVAEFLNSPIGRTPPELASMDGSLALTYVAFDQSLAWAERAGKILPTETQFEFAATGGGVSRFPWGDDAERIPAWSIGPAGEPPLDHTNTTPPIHGLYSNAAEWTVTWMQHYPRHKALQIPTPFEPRDYRVIRGAPPSAINQGISAVDAAIGPRNRIILLRGDVNPSVGFRCARSVRPHLTAGEFESVLRDGK